MALNKFLFSEPFLFLLHHYILFNFVFKAIGTQFQNKIASTLPHPPLPLVSFPHPKVIDSKSFYISISVY